MGRQIELAYTTKDLQELLEFADEFFLALPTYVERDAIPDVVKPTEFISQLDRRRKARFFYLMSSEFAVVEAFYHHPNGGEIERLQDRTSPVVEVPGYLSDSPVGGRIYLGMDRGLRFYDQASKAYEKLTRYVRKHWSKSEGSCYYFGPEASSMANSGARPSSSPSRGLQIEGLLSLGDYVIEELFSGDRANPIVAADLARRCYPRVQHRAATWAMELLRKK